MRSDSEELSLHGPEQLEDKTVVKELVQSLGDLHMVPRHVVAEAVCSDSLEFAVANNHSGV